MFSLTRRTLIFLSLIFLCVGQEDLSQENESEQPALAENTSAQNITTSEEEQEKFEFPEPHLEVDVMVEAAKDFIHKYLTAKKWHALKRLLQTVRDIGGTRRDGWRTVSVFLARILSSEQKKEIMRRRPELYKIFGEKIGLDPKKKRKLH